MMKLSLLICVGAWVTMALASDACFQLDGTDSWLYFNSTVKLGDGAHYKLQFKSKKDNGLIFFARGQQRDFEALFLNKGKLTYFLFNPTEYGTGSTYGTYIECTKKISKNYLHKVEFYRNEAFKDDDGTNTFKSGIKLDGAEFKEIGFCTGVNIVPQFFIGGTQEDIQTEVPRFEGEIKNFIEEKSGQMFEKATFQQAVLKCEDSS